MSRTKPFQPCPANHPEQIAECLLVQYDPALMIYRDVQGMEMRSCVLMKYQSDRHQAIPFTRMLRTFDRAVSDSGVCEICRRHCHLLFLCPHVKYGLATARWTRARQQPFLNSDTLLRTCESVTCADVETSESQLPP
jgi:hypothetical protein